MYNKRISLTSFSSLTGDAKNGRKNIASDFKIQVVGLKTETHNLSSGISFL